MAAIRLQQTSFLSAVDRARIAGLLRLVVLNSHNINLLTLSSPITHTPAPPRYTPHIRFILQSTVSISSLDNRRLSQHKFLACAVEASIAQLNSAHLLRLPFLLTDAFTRSLRALNHLFQDV